MLGWSTLYLGNILSWPHNSIEGWALPEMPGQQEVQNIIKCTVYAL